MPTVGAGILLRHDNLDFLFLSGDGGNIGVVILPQPAQFHFRNSIACVAIRRG